MNQNQLEKGMELEGIRGDLMAFQRIVVFFAAGPVALSPDISDTQTIGN